MPLKIYKRGQIYHYSGTVAGGRIRGSTRTSNRDIAQQIANREEARAFECSINGPEAVLKFSEAAILYRKAGKQTRFLAVVEDHWKDTLVKNIKPGAVRQAAIEVYPRASNATRIRQFITPTQAVINHSAEMELCSSIKVGRKSMKIEKKIKDPFTVEWVNAFRQHASPELGALALLMFVTGARISEALRVEWDDVDLNARTVTFRKTKISEARQAHLPMPLVVALATLPRVEGRPVFKYRKRAHLIGQWNTAVKRAGIKRLTPHSGRHGFATALLRNQVDAKTGAWLGGWKSIRHFMETYAHAIQDITITDRILGTTVTQDAGEVQKTLRNKG